MGAEGCRPQTDIRGREEPVTVRGQKLWFPTASTEWLKTLSASKASVALPGDSQDVLNGSQEEVLVR